MQQAPARRIERQDVADWAATQYAELRASVQVSMERTIYRAAAPGGH